MASQKPTITTISERITLGEGPHWDKATQSLFYVDIIGGTIHKYVPATNKHTKANIKGGSVSLIVPVENQPNKYLISIERQLVIVTWDGVSDTVSKIDTVGQFDGVTGTRFNDGKCDSAGRLWVGSMGDQHEDGTFDKAKGSLYSFVPNGSLNFQIGEIGISNGIAFNDKLKKFYYIDSLERKVHEFHFDIEKGTISNRKSIFDFETVKVPGLPDGMAIDTEGKLWVAVYDGGRVIRIDPTIPNTLMTTIEMPAKQVTSVAFGGPNLDELYVTTANMVVNNIKLEAPNGSLFKITNPGAKGLPATKVKMSTGIDIVGGSLEVGTRCHWDAENKCLYSVDVPTSIAYKYIPTTGRIYQTKVGNEPLAFMFPVEGNATRFIAGLGRKLCIVTWDGISETPSNVETIREVDTNPDFSANRLNGGKVDPSGRLWAGTMGPNDSEGNTVPKRGSLYSLERQIMKTHIREIGISNGIAWNYEKNKMYYIDTLDPVVYQFDYDTVNGEMKNRKIIFNLKRHNIPGLPDGMTIDTEGKLWVACIHGSKIIRIDPDTTNLLHTIDFPVSQVTALCFGGPKLDVLYVTTAKMAVDGLVPSYPAGCTFAVHGLGVRGLIDSGFKM